MEKATIKEQLNVMEHKTLSLQDYANVYVEIHNTGISTTENYLTPNVVSTVLSQYHISKGLKIFGGKGVGAVLKELRQLQEIMVMEPKFTNNMNKKQKKTHYNT